MADADSIPEVRPCRACGGSDRYPSGRCRPCTAIKCREYYLANKNEIEATNAKWRAENREKVNANSVAWATANREKNRAIKQKWADANPEKIKAKSKAYYAKNSEKLIAVSKQWDIENREKANAADAAWRANNPERHKAAYTAWRKANRERHLATQAKWRNENPEFIRMRDAARRETGKKSSIKAKGLIARLMKLQRGLCPCCKLPLGEDFHMDHIEPLSRGGANSKSNIQLMRAECNMHKNAKDPIDFMQSRGYLL